MRVQEGAGPLEVAFTSANIRMKFVADFQMTSTVQKNYFTACVEGREGRGGGRKE